MPFTPEQKRAWRSRKRQQGLCLHCYDPAVPGHTRCEAHLLEHSKTMGTYRDREPENILWWIKRLGGINTRYSFNGELKAHILGPRGQAPGFPPGFINDKSPWTFDQLTEEAINEGFLMPGSNENDLLEAIINTAQGDLVIRDRDRDLDKEYLEEVKEYYETR